MYSRYHDNAPVRIPENYSGIAFSERGEAEKQPPSPPHRLDVAKPTPPPKNQSTETPTMPPPPRVVVLPPRGSGEEMPQSDLQAPKQEDESHPYSQKPNSEPSFLKPFEGLFGQLGHAFPFSHGLGFDELLLLGLILLIAQSDTESSDVVLWLVLLLFCG